MNKKHLIILGGGSAAFAATIRANELGSEVTIINDGLPIGGTCVNVGCVPSKTLIRAAEAHHRASHHNFNGISSNSKIDDFKAVIDQKRSLVNQLQKSKYIEVISNLSGVRLIDGHGALINNETVEVNGEQIKGDNVIIATGASPKIPEINGISRSGYLTNETLFELEEVPESLIVIGGRYIALESAQMFSRFGSKVTVLQRSSRILPHETADITDALTTYLKEEGLNIFSNVTIKGVQKENNQMSVETNIDGQPETFKASHLLIATGREPNTRNIGIDTIGIKTNQAGFLTVDGSLRTNVSNIYGAGDVIGEPMFVYTAAYEGKLAAENAILNTAIPADYEALPWVIFTDPQLAGVGLDENHAEKNGFDAESTILPLTNVPRFLAARDTRGFIKLIRDRRTDKFLGARVLAPEGSELMMEISLAIKHGITTKELASAFHPYLTLSEGIKLAALSFKKDVKKLSCCAS